MRTLLNTIAAILGITWLIAIIGFRAHGMIHLLAVFAILALIFSLFRAPKKHQRSK